MGEVIELRQPAPIEWCWECICGSQRFALLAKDYGIGGGQVQCIDCHTVHLNILWIDSDAPPHEP